MIKEIKYIIFFLALLTFFSSIASGRESSIDSLIVEIKTTFVKTYNIEQSGIGNVDMLEYSAAVFRKNLSTISSEEISYKTKKYKYVKNVGKYFKRIALGIYDFKDSVLLFKALNDFLEGHEVIPQVFFKDGKHAALSPPFLIIIKENTLIFFYAKCEDIPGKKEWDKISDEYINLSGKHFLRPEYQVIRCYCSGPVFIVK